MPQVGVMLQIAGSLHPVYRGEINPSMLSKLYVMLLQIFLSTTQILDCHGSIEIIEESAIKT